MPSADPFIAAMRLRSFGLLGLPLLAASAAAQSTPPDCARLSDTGATVVVPASAALRLDDGVLPRGTAIGGVGADGACYGATVWRGPGTSFNLRGDDPQTPTRDGLLPGDTLRFALWDSTGRVLSRAVRIRLARIGGAASADTRYTSGSVYAVETLDAVWRATPAPLRPAAGAAVRADAPLEIAWSALAGASRYALELWRGPADARARVGAFVTDVPAFALAAGLPAGAYAWRVQAEGAGDAWSAFTPFEASSAVAAEADESAPSAAFTAGPNPSAGAVTLRFTLVRPAHVRVLVFDVLGRERARLVDGVLPAGAHEAVWQGRDAAPGTYVAVVDDGRERRSTRLVRTR